MTFKTIGLETDECNCLQTTFVDLENTYTRMINKPQVLEKDFKTNWERDKIEEGCEKLCNRTKSLSVNKFNKENQDKIISKYINIRINNIRKGKDSIAIFQLNENGGKFKHRPSRGDESHHDLFKSDTFSIDLLNIIEIIELADTEIYKNLIEKRDEHSK